MKRVVVRYKVEAARIAEHEELIRNVFAADIAERCEEKPVSSPATAIGAYRADDAPA